MLTQEQIKACKDNILEAIKKFDSCSTGSNGFAVRTASALAANRLRRIVRWKAFMDGSVEEIMGVIMQSFPEHNHEMDFLRKELILAAVATADEVEMGVNIPVSWVPTSYIPTDEPSCDEQALTDAFINRKGMNVSVAEYVSQHIERVNRQKQRDQDIADLEEDFPDAPPHEDSPVV